MTRINPDPYAGRHLFALVNRVTGLLDNEEQVKATVRALEEGGVATEDIDIFTGEEGARRLDLSGREHGRAFRLLRTLEAAVGDERETNQRIDEALRRGSSLVCVKVHKADAATLLKAFVGALNSESSAATGTDDGKPHASLSTELSRIMKRKNDEKARALRVLKELHAHEIHYWGPWSFEDVPSS